jgi:hypothetical protein
MLPFNIFYQANILKRVLKSNCFSIYIKIKLNLKKTAMSKERDIQILEHKIAELEIKIANFVKYGISEKKKQNLELLKLKYEDQLAEIVI